MAKVYVVSGFDCCGGGVEWIEAIFADEGDADDRAALLRSKESADVSFTVDTYPLIPSKGDNGSTD